MIRAVRKIYQDETGCPGIDECEKVQMSPGACEGCQNRSTEPGNDENDTDDYIPYAQYLLEQIERIEMNLPPFLEGFDSLFLPHIKREKQRIYNEYVKKELNKKKKDKNE